VADVELLINLCHSLLKQFFLPDIPRAPTATTKKTMLERVPQPISNLFPSFYLSNNPLSNLIFPIYSPFAGVFLHITTYPAIIFHFPFFFLMFIHLLD
jgi:hypothetical protein